MVLAREFDFWNEFRAMTITFGMMMIVCTCYYFLLCREWCCQYAWCIRLQYF